MAVGYVIIGTEVRKDDRPSAPMSIDAPNSINDEGLFCPTCNYDLRAISSDRCPECGMQIERGGRDMPLLPWSHRKTLGTLRAYFRTGTLAVLHPARLAREALRPVHWTDAKQFRRTTVLIAYTPLLVLMAFAIAFVHYGAPGGWGNVIFARGTIWEFHSMYGYHRPLHGEWLGWAAEACVALVAAGALWFFLSSASRLAALFFYSKGIPRERQARYMLLSLYTSAPLCLLPIPLIALSMAWRLTMLRSSRVVFELSLFQACVLGGVGGLAILLLTWWIATLILLQRSTFCGAGRLVLTAASWPIATLLLALGCMLSVLAAMFVSIVVLSLAG